MVVCVPFASLFSAPDVMSEHIDEVIFGDGVEAIEEYGNFYKIKTDYDYIGWINKTDVARVDFSPNYIVVFSFSDLLFEDRYFQKPKMALPRGATIEIVGEDGRFLKVKDFDGDICYIRKEHIRPVGSVGENIRESIVSTALSYVGTQYRWGGRTASGIDCSGLCFNAYRFNGIRIWRDADIEKSKNLRKIPLETAKKGDLLFFKGHMAIYLGDGKLLHSSASNGGVAVEELNEKLREIYICAGTAF